MVNTSGIRAAIAFSLLLAGCVNPLPPTGTWHGVIELAEGKALAFTLYLDLSAARPSGHFLVSDEKTPVPEIFRSGQTLNLNFSEYGAEMRGTWDGRAWKGVYLRHRTTGTKGFRFSAAPAGADRPSPAALPAEVPAGTFLVKFQGEEEDQADTVATFWKTETALLGTFIAPDGDYGLLEGRAQDDGRLALHRFTGWQATLIDLEPAAGNWNGTFYAASNDTPMPFNLQTRSNLELKPPAQPQARMKNADARFTFACADPSGKIVRNTDERFKGKAMIVDIMGTWCHNCLDAAPVLQQLQTQFGKEGLEIVGLSFEIQDDAVLARKNLTLFKERFGITYDLLFCGSLDDPNVDRRLKSQIEDFFAYPTTLFIAREGKVKTIHSGFKGPGAGEAFKAQVAEFHELALSIVR